MAEADQASIIQSRCRAFLAPCLTPTRDILEQGAPGSLTLNRKRHGQRSCVVVGLRVTRAKGDVSLEALPTKEGMEVALLLFRPEDERVVGIKSGAEFRKLFEVRQLRMLRCVSTSPGQPAPKAARQDPLLSSGATIPWSPVCPAL